MQGGGLTTTRHKIAIIHIPANANPLTILLSMSHTAATFVESKENGLITRYRNYFGLPITGETDYPEKHSWSTVPAGYLSSSVSDMAKYLQMYLNEGMGIISQNSLNTMLYENVYVDSDAPLLLRNGVDFDGRIYRLCIGAFWAN